MNSKKGDRIGRTCMVSPTHPERSIAPTTAPTPDKVTPPPPEVEATINHTAKQQKITFYPPPLFSLEKN